MTLAFKMYVLFFLQNHSLEIFPFFLSKNSVGGLTIVHNLEDLPSYLSFKALCTKNNAYIIHRSAVSLQASITVDTI